MEIRNKNVLLTGGLGSIGCEIVDHLKRKGANIYVFDVKESGEKNYFRVDITDEDEVRLALENINNIDILINCAGEIYSELLFHSIKKERHKRYSWDRVINNNLSSCFNVTSQIAEKMIKNHTKGVIINFSSISARGNAGQVAYSSAKAGVESFTKAAAKEVGMFKIRICAIAPGFIETYSTKSALSASNLEYLIKQTALKRLGTTDDILKTIDYIIDCDFVTGCTLPVDGGLSI